MEENFTPELFSAVRDAEQSVCGCVILDSKKVLPEIIDVVKPEQFYFGDTRAIYKACLELSARGNPVDYISILNNLTGKEPESSQNIKKDLLHCAQLTPSISQAKYYAELVSGHYKSRRLKEIGKNIFESDISPDTVDEVSNSAMSDLYSLAKPRSNKKLTSLKDIGIDVWQDYISEDSGNELRVDTGFKRLDSILKGMFAGNLIVVAARPKVGKSAFAATIAENVARAGKTVAFYSMEMSNREVYERILSRNSATKMDVLIDKKFKDKQWAESQHTIGCISTAIDELCGVPMYVNENTGITTNDIRCECRMIQNLGLIVIDYLQLMKPTKRCENRNQEVGQITRELKILASDLGVPVLLLSQLNRTSNEFQRPTSNELRDSGNIEQDANKVILMWCIEENRNDLGRLISKKVGIDVNLNRRGSTGVTVFDFLGEYMTLTETDEKYEDKPKVRSNWRNEV